MVRPSFFPVSLAELAASLLRLAARASEGLAALAGMDPHSSSVLTTGVARYGKLMLVSLRLCSLRIRTIVAQNNCCPRLPV